MLKYFIKVALILLCFATLTGLRCLNSLLNPQPAATGDLYPEGATIRVDDHNNNQGDSECLLPVSHLDSTLVVDIEDNRTHSVWVWDNIARIEYRVTLGLVESGMTLADTTGFVSLENMGTTTRISLKLSGPIPAGKNQVAINSVLRYLDGSGHLALPIRQAGFYCYLQW